MKQHLLGGLSILIMGCSGDSETSSVSEPEVFQPEMPILKIDPIESDPRYAQIFEKIDEEVSEELSDHPRNGLMGFVHIYWETKKRILQENYNLDWRSPAEMNPDALFD